DAADGFSQVSTRDLKPSAATPPATAAPQTTVAEPAPPTPVAMDAKPPPPPAANGSPAAGSPADSEKAPPAAVAAPPDAAAAATAPPKRAPLVAAPLLDPPRTYEKDAKTIRALISLEDGPGLLVVAPADATVADICQICQPRVEKRFGKNASLALKLGVYGALPSTTKSLPDSARFEGIIRRTRASQVSLGGGVGEKRTRKAARTARKRFRGAADSSSDDDYNAGGCLPVAAVAPPSDAGELRARARVLFAELSMLTDGAARRPSFCRGAAARHRRRVSWRPRGDETAVDACWFDRRGDARRRRGTAQAATRPTGARCARSSPRGAGASTSTATRSWERSRPTAGPTSRQSSSGRRTRPRRRSGRSRARTASCAIWSSWRTARRTSCPRWSRPRRRWPLLLRRSGSSRRRRGTCWTRSTSPLSLVPV
ncbi:unnamed protein product, partial [Pelagomonas calceolata]